MKRQNDRILKEELPRWLGAQYATGDQWRNNSRKNEGREPKQKQYPVVDVTGDKSRVQCCKKQYCISSVQFNSVAQSHPTICDHMNCSTPSSSVHGISQARILEWVAIFFSRGSSQPRDQTQVSLIAGGFFTNCTTREAQTYGYQSGTGGVN